MNISNALNISKLLTFYPTLDGTEFEPFTEGFGDFERHLNLRLGFDIAIS